MGMYDYLAGEQVKCFYKPIFSYNDGTIFCNEGNPTTWHSCGELRSYEYNEELPLKTLYYKYPKSFIIFNYRYVDRNSFIIKNGKLKELKNYKDITETDLGEAVYDYYGTQINISKIEDFQNMINDFTEYENKLDELKEYYFSDKTMNEIKNNPNKYDDLINDYDFKINEVNNKMMNKWIVKDEFELEKQFGEFLDCFLRAETYKDCKITEWNNPMREYLEIKKVFKKFIDENNNIVQKYLKWLELNVSFKKDVENEIKEVLK